MGGDGKVVEIDEIYLGDINGTPRAKRGKAGVANKRMVVALVERGGPVRSFHLKRNINKEKAKSVLFENVDRMSDFVTGDHRPIPPLVLTLPSIAL